MAERRDYYEILGVPRDADPKSIKSAFRELALRYHPDRSDDPEAEERFKEIAEAYAVLGNPEKRAAYDAGGFAGVSGFGPEDLYGGLDVDDLFGGLGFDFGGIGRGGLFDRLFGGARRGPPRGAHVEARVAIPLAVVAHGGQQRVAVRHPRACSTCSGSGARPGTTPRACADCGGAGQRVSTSQKGGVHMQTVTACPTCAGRGHFIDDPCTACGGRGLVAEAESLTVTIPVGIHDGMVLRVPGKGMPPPAPGGSAGDLHVVVETLPDPRFTRRGPHLWREQEIGVADAVLGTSLTVPTLDGRAKLQVPAGTQPASVLRLRGKGLPEFGGGVHGDLYVALRVSVPADLSAEERALWERLRELGAAAGDREAGS